MTPERLNTSFCLLLVLFSIIRLIFAPRSACAVCTDMAVDRDIFFSFAVPLLCSSLSPLHPRAEEER